MKSLITGVAGFIGSKLASKLLEAGHEVIGLDSFSDYYDERLKRQNLANISDSDKFSFVSGDLLNVDLNELLRDVEYIFHQAGQPGVRKSWGDEFRIYSEANILATQRLLEAAKASGDLKRFVYASSSSIYGDAETFPTLESALPNPISPYGVSKLAAEHLVTLYGRNFDVPTTSLRYFTVYGPGQRPDMAFTRFLTAALAGSEIRVFGDGNQVRDFTFVDDIVSANIAAASADSQYGAIYNVAGGSSVTVNEVLGTIERIHGNSLNVVHLPVIAGDVFRTGGSTELAGQDLGWKSTTDLETGLRLQYEWAKLNHEILTEATAK
ncbi:NAD-dependent epimerase/dehydratase family protein [Arthrobacter sp. NPDC056727]|uniref:NAD-dependent epimerase/dehydratase family protein n=1 Tax=Arthrobacter sp. NPDC056727 TaxID=3345927 RepID=UPI00366D0F55